MGGHETVETIVVGASQAGLAAGHHLERRGRCVLLLDREPRIGAAWRARWDTLRLFTPASYSHLPGAALRAVDPAAPTKDEVADHLAAYARGLHGPVLGGVDVDVVEPGPRGGFIVHATDGRAWRSRAVVVATGAHRVARVPVFADAVTAPQRTSLTYRRPGDLPPGRVLVVGAGNSGAEIALDLARAGREVTLAGRDVGHLPDVGARTYPVMQAAGRLGSALSRRALGPGGEPLGRVRPGHLTAAGVRRVPRVVGTRAGLVETADATTVDVDVVVWCTGLAPEHRLLRRLPVCDGVGALVHRGGVTTVPGLVAVGLPHQSAVTSHLLGGVGADARRVAALLCRTLGARRPAGPAQALSR